VLRPRLEELAQPPAAGDPDLVDAMAALSVSVTRNARPSSTA
jgi:hypothetical protein